MNRNLWLLSAVQVLFMIGNMMFVAFSPILGKQLAGNVSLATMPIAVSMLTMLLCSFPLSVLMGKFGRGPIFSAGLASNAIAGLVFFSAIQMQSFVVLIIGSVFFGFSIACANFYRFAAMELVDKKNQSLAISAVMAAGVMAALIGPNLSAITKDAFFDLAFSSSVLTYLPLSLLALCLVVFIKWPVVNINNEQSQEAVNYQHELWKPMLTAAVAYAVMVLIMSATPLHMAHQHYHYSDSAWVIQWHLLGMFAPSFFVGWLVKRIGLMGLLIFGALITISSLLVNLNAYDRQLLTLGLFLLGIGWNFLFIGASQWLMKLSEGKNSSRIQGVNEVMVFGLATLATLSSGWLLSEFGWVKLNLAAIPLLLALLFILLKTTKQKQLQGITS